MFFCCGSKSAVEEPRQLTDFEIAQRLQAKEDAQARLSQTRVPAQPPRNAPRRSDWGTGATGQRLGGQSEALTAAGDEAAERRRKALEAAERRTAAQPGVTKERAAELARQRQREELLGRVIEQYHRLGEDMPMGLNAASAEQLRKHLDNLRSR
eukprot:TRINITY_DN3839_c0_g1_i1.p1 TRINITY_DN3839_c0_g1~~TRINITY_DN3839_c0_g1_i1.p1  ORF type:complete len:154 (+),score=37.48 TRINITY_DN3839_c0_g1_i1:101-562(+)